MTTEEPRTHGFVITAPMSSAKDPAQILRIALSKRKEGADVTIFLIGDGVYMATRGHADQGVEALVKAGASLLVSEPHLRAAGLSKTMLVEGAELIDRTYKELVVKVMEEWDRVVVC